MCCIVCVCIGYRKCDNIGMVMEIVERLWIKEYYKLFVVIGKLEKEMMDIKNELEKNIMDIEEMLCNLFEEVEVLYIKL